MSKLVDNYRKDCDMFGEFSIGYIERFTEEIEHLEASLQSERESSNELLRVALDEKLQLEAKLSAYERQVPGMSEEEFDDIMWSSFPTGYYNNFVKNTENGIKLHTAATAPRLTPKDAELLAKARKEQ